MTAIIITAIIAFDCGLLFGAFWFSREKDELDQEYLDNQSRIYNNWRKERAKETAKRLLEGL